jgi:hypothetical protein
MNNFYEGWTEVHPGPDESLRDVAELLVHYAGDDKHHVRTIKGGNAFLVHPSVARRYNGGKRRSSTKKGEDA